MSLTYRSKYLSLISNKNNFFHFNPVNLHSNILSLQCVHPLKQFEILLISEKDINTLRFWIQMYHLHLLLRIIVHIVLFCSYENREQLSEVSETVLWINRYEEIYFIIRSKTLLVLLPDCPVTWMWSWETQTAIRFDFNKKSEVELSRKKLCSPPHHLPPENMEGIMGGNYAFLSL